MNIVYPPLILLSMLSTFLPCFYGSLLLKKELPAYRLLWAFFLFAVIAECALFVLSSFKYPTQWIFKLYTAVEYVLISLVLARWHQKKAISKLISSSIFLYLAIFALIEFVLLGQSATGKINHISRGIALLLLSASVFLTLNDIWSRAADSLTKDFRFWMLMAMALYYCSSLVPIVFMFAEDWEFLKALFQIHAPFNILHNLVFCVGIYIGRKYGMPPTRPPGLLYFDLPDE